MWKRLFLIFLATYLAAWVVTATHGKTQVIGQWKQSVLPTPELGLRESGDGKYVVLHRDGSVFCSYKLSAWSPVPFFIEMEVAARYESMLYSYAVAERWLWFPGIPKRTSIRTLWIACGPSGRP